ncbi:MAG: FecR domain-containing protein [Chitinophagaceae bacterium]
MNQFDPQFLKATFILKYLRNELNSHDKAQLDTWLAENQKNQILFEQLTNEQVIQNELKFFETLSVDMAWQNIKSQTVEKNKVININRRRRWWYVAAAAVVLIGVYTLYLFPEKRSTHTDIVKNKTEKPDIAPGGNKAILTLADGTSIILDTALNGDLASQGNVKVIKIDGQITYNPSGKTTDIVYNTISTPRGGQYQLILADGSKVWLNAASTLRFPTAFNSNERKVDLTGEGYFEVAHNAAKQFKVNVAGKGDVEVLGTQFNISSYSDEKDIKTTLLEGKVRMTAAGNSQILAPGQQAQLKANGTITVINNVNTEEVIAWKNGLFKLNSADIPTIMRQIARWYDLEIVYLGKIPEGHISGTVPMNMSLSKVLDALQLSGINFTMEGKKMIIRP